MPNVNDALSFSGCRDTQDCKEPDDHTCISNTCSYAYLKRLPDVVASSLEMCVSHFTFPLRWY